MPDIAVRFYPRAQPSGDHIAPGGFAFSTSAMTNNFDLLRILNPNPQRAWADVWHLWTVTLPRRSITGRLVWGKVWRRHDGRHWIYKKFVEYADSDY